MGGLMIFVKKSNLNVVILEKKKFEKKKNINKNNNTIRAADLEFTQFRNDFLGLITFMHK